MGCYFREEASQVKQSAPVQIRQRAKLPHNIVYFLFWLQGFGQVTEGRVVFEGNYGFSKLAHNLLKEIGDLVGVVLELLEDREVAQLQMDTQFFNKATVSIDTEQTLGL